MNWRKERTKEKEKRHMTCKKIKAGGWKWSKFMPKVKMGYFEGARMQRTDFCGG